MNSVPWDDYLVKNPVVILEGAESTIILVSGNAKYFFVGAI